MALEYFNIQGIDSYDNPLQAPVDGQLIHAVNVTNFPNGALSKRPGYIAFLGTPDTNQVNSLLYYPRQTGTSLYLYRASGSSLYYSFQGTGAWTLAGNGTIANNSHFGAAILNNVFIGGDNNGSTRHTNNGTSFTNTGSAPIAQYYTQFSNRIYTANGLNGTVNYSSANDATNWSNSGTSDSSFIQVLGAGAAERLFVAGDRLIIPKSKGAMYNWDSQTLVDMATNLGPTMPWALGQMDDLFFYSNQVGIISFDGANKNILSNSVQRQFYNRQANGISGTMFGTVGVGATYIWDYLMTMGTITDDFTGRQISNALLKYDHQKNTFLNWQFNDFPTAMLPYIDLNNQRQLIFGNNSGQCFQLSQTATSDNGAAISSEAVFLFTYASQSNTFTQTSAQTSSGITWEKKWDWIRLFFNPGNEVNIQYAFSNSLTYQHLKWSETINMRPNANGAYWQESDGKIEIRFPDNINNPRRSSFLFLRIYESSDSATWSYYGCQIGATPQIVQ